MESKTVYFEHAGPERTGETLELARTRALELGIRQVVLASYSGKTGAEAVKLFDTDAVGVIVAAGVVGSKEPNASGMLGEHLQAIEAGGGTVFHSGHAFGMVGRAVHKRLGAIQVDEIVAYALRVFCQGVKVCCEVACMAADAGLLRTGEEAIAIAGTGRGADTAVVLTPANTHAFFETRVHEILCKPRM